METDRKTLNDPSEPFESMYKTDREFKADEEQENNYLSSPYAIEAHEGNSNKEALPSLKMTKYNAESNIAQFNKNRAIKFNKNAQSDTKNLDKINSKQDNHSVNFHSKHNASMSSSAFGSRKLNKTISADMKLLLNKEREKQSHLSRDDKKQIQSIYSTIVNKEKSPRNIEDGDKSCNYTDYVDEKKTILNSIPSLYVHASNLNLVNVPTDRNLIEDVPVNSEIKPTYVEGKSNPSFRKLNKHIPKKSKQQQQLAKASSEEKFYKRYQEKKRNTINEKIQKPITFTFSQRFFMKANDLIVANSTSNFYNSSSIKDNNLTEKKSEIEDDINENVESGQAPTTRQLNSITNLNSGQISPIQVNAKKVSKAEDKSIKHNTYMNKTINKYLNSSQNTSTSRKKEDIVHSKFEKYNIQTLGYESYKSYSHAKIDPSSPFLDRMAFYSIKNKYKQSRIEESVKSQIPKITPDKEIDIINKLIEDSNRRELAKVNVEHQIAQISSKSKLNSHPKLSEREWNLFYEKNIKERAETSKQAKEEVIRGASEKKRLKEIEELEEINKFRRVVSEEKAKSIFERLSSSQPMKKQNSRDKFDISAGKVKMSNLLNCNKSSQNFHSKSNSKYTKNQSISLDIKANLSEKRFMKKQPQVIKRDNMTKERSSLNIYMSNAENNKNSKSKLTIKSDISKSESQKLNFSGTSNSGYKTTLSKILK